MIQIIPAIDIIDGKCVRLTQGDYTQKKIYNEHPLEVALQFENAGIKRLHLVDLDGAKKGEVVNWKVLETIASKTKLTIDFGGGIKTEKDIAIVFQSGSSMATVGSIAVKEPDLFFSWLKKYGADNILLAADVKEEKVSVGGWIETTKIDILDFITSNMNNGVTQLFCTDIAKDGLLQGPSTDLYKKIITAFPKLKLIASGGVAKMDDVEKLNDISCAGVIIGKAIYENTISLSALKRWL